MAGVRIVHATERSVLYTLVDGSRPYGTPITCAACGRVHLFKTYHIALDAQGAAIVSPEIVERLKRLGPSTGFSMREEIAKPPVIRVGMAGRMNGQDGRIPLAVNRHLIEPH